MPILYIAKRLGLVLVTAMCATFLTFVLLRMAPGDPAEVILQKVFVGTEDFVAGHKARQEIQKRFGLSRPLVVQYGCWLADAARGDFGHSYTSGHKVSEEILLRIRPTLYLSVPALGVSLALTLFFGCLFGIMRNSSFKTILETGIIASIAIPNFYLALIFILLFSLHWNLLPVSGYGTVQHYILPVATLALTLFGYTTTILKDSSENVRHQGFILTARGKGLAPITMFRRHILRNAMIPVIPYIALQLGYMLGGVVVVESVFSWPGLGSYLVESIQARDVPVIQACVTFIALAFSSANLVADLVLWGMDPRVRFAS